MYEDNCLGLEVRLQKFIKRLLDFFEMAAMTSEGSIKDATMAWTLLKTLLKTLSRMLLMIAQLLKKIK